MVGRTNHFAKQIVDRKGYFLCVAFNEPTEVRWINMRPMLTAHPQLSKLRESENWVKFAEIYNDGIRILGRVSISGPTLYHMGGVEISAVK